ncbi:pilin [Candidatus Parcubacteria bacterium]|nr:pilin [Candidatus Parcubacteria bacterium]
MKKNKVFIYLVFLAVLLPVLAFGQIDLEQDYPSWSKDAPNLQSIVKNNSLGEVINFFVTWAIIISVLLAALSLVYGGAMYLFSAGQVNKTTNAKKRIRESFYGLLILAGSFLVLQFINPQVTILQIQKTAISSGTVLFSRDAFDITPPVATPGIADVINGFAENKTLEQLSEEGKLVYLNGSFPDLTKSSGLGDLVADGWDPSNNTPTSANFRKFSVYALGFWGEKSAGIEVHLFLEKNYAGKETIFTEQGQIVNEKVVASAVQYNAGGQTIQVIPLKGIAFGVSPINLEDGGSLTKPNIPVITYDNNNKISINHPPLSASLKGKGIGVNLFADLATSYGMRYLNENFSDFRLFDFDDKAITLELVTKDPKKKEPDKDLIVLISSGVDYKNEGKVMFTIRPAGSLNNIIPKIYFNEEFYKGFEMRTGVDGIFNGGQFNFFASDIKATGREPLPLAHNSDVQPEPNLSAIYQKFSTQPIPEIGNVKPYDPSNTTSETGYIETVNQYGAMEGASSLQVLELSDKLDSCRSVKVCDGPYGNGHCFNFIDNQQAKPKEDTLNLPMPWYIPVNLPDKITASLPTQAGSLDFKAQFNDNIKSIIIDGKCLVVLYKHKIKYKNNNSPEFDQWDGGQNYAEAFTQTVNDLTSSAGGGYQMGRCTQHFADSLTLGDISTCASAIVVFPIK